MSRTLFIMVIVVAALAPAIAQQPTFSIRSETVRVDALVTDRGRPVRGLRPDDFELLDSGIPQQIAFVNFEELPLTVTMALDVSASISREGLGHLRDGGHAVLENLKPQDQASLMTFADEVTVREPLTSMTGRLERALDALQTSDEVFAGTALIDACYAAMTVTDDGPGRGLLIVFTDGVDTSSWLPAARVLDVFRRADLVAYAVSTAPLPKGSFLRELSEVTGGGAIQISSSDAIRSTFVRILDEFRQRYIVSYSPSNVPASGWHPITLRVRNRKVDIKSRAGYTR
jgi:VWFA-related protein